jgi:hypothetical protein
MGIVRLYNDNNEIILIVCAYLEHVPIRTLKNRRLNPFDNVYKYLYHHGHLWVDMVTVSRIHSPLVGLLDRDCNYPLTHTIDGSLNVRFHIHTPFYNDSRLVSSHIQQSYHKVVRNLLENIPLPNETELLLFKSYAYPAIDNTLSSNEDIEIDLEEH